MTVKMVRTNARRFGFVIERFVRTANYKVFEIPSDMPMTVQAACPCDNEPLQTLCTLVGNGGRQKMRIGRCALCRYIGYTDRPTREWINQFYLDTWDGANDAAKKPVGNSLGDDSKSEKLARLIDGLPIDKERYACEIGCGYGHALMRLRRLGFRRAVGIENSRHRAELCRSLGFEVFASAFEDASTIDALRKFAPFSLLFSNHVLEHVYNPALLIRRAAELQNVGDHFVLSVPCNQGESFMAVLFFLPHLHSFSRESVRALFEHNGYEIVSDALSTDREVNIVARRTNRTVPALKQDVRMDAYAYAARLGLPAHFPISRCLRFSKDYDRARIVPFWYDVLLQRPFIQRVSSKLLSLVGRNFRYLSAIVRGLDSRHVSSDESLLEIQFDGNIQLLIK